MPQPYTEGELSIPAYRGGQHGSYNPHPTSPPTPQQHQHHLHQQPQPQHQHQQHQQQHSQSQYSQSSAHSNRPSHNSHAHHLSRQNPDPRQDVRLKARDPEIRVGQYTIKKTLGEGSFGKVKLAVHQVSGQKVALKIISRRKLINRDMAGRVEREIAYLQLLRHPHIIKL